MLQQCNGMIDKCSIMKVQVVYKMFVTYSNVFCCCGTGMASELGAPKNPAEYLGYIQRISIPITVQFKSVMALNLIFNELSC